jgi:glycosyltransferase involved in cell wall biosynthesis
MFSIVIPVLNESQALPLLLDDLLDQSYQDFEVIVVDGGSIDDTRKKAKAFEGRFKNFLFLQAPLSGVSLQRNLGAKKARGEYIIFFDADVRIPKDYTYGISQHIKEKKYCVLTTNITSKKRLFREYLVTISANIGREFLIKLGYPFVGGYNIVVKRSLFWGVQGFNPELYYAEDVDLVKRLATHGFMVKNVARPYLYFSFRRFDEFGYTRVLFDYIRHLWMTDKIIEGKKPLNTYPMGGQVYKK